MTNIAVYFTGDIDPETGDMRMEQTERAADDGATITAYTWTFPDGATVHGTPNTDPTLTVFYEPQDQGDGK